MKSILKVVNMYLRSHENRRQNKEQDDAHFVHHAMSVTYTVESTNLQFTQRRKQKMKRFNFLVLF